MVKKIFLISTAVFILSFAPVCSFAQVPTPELPSNPPQDIRIFDVVTNLGNLILGISGAVVIVMVVVGGIRYVASGGSPALIEGAKKTLVSALVALAIIILSAGMLNTVNYILNSDGSISGGGSGGGGSGGSGGSGGGGSGGGDSGGNTSNLPTFVQNLIKDRKCTSIYQCSYGQSSKGYWCHTGGAEDNFYNNSGSILCNPSSTAGSTNNPRCQNLNIRSCSQVWPTSSGTGGGSGGGTTTNVPPDKTCAVDADCGCGILKGAAANSMCFIANVQYLAQPEKCSIPDFCSGITGQMTIKCVNKTCVQQ